MAAVAQAGPPPPPPPGVIQFYEEQDQQSNIQPGGQTQTAQAQTTKHAKKSAKIAQKVQQLGQIYDIKINNNSRQQHQYFATEDGLNASALSQQRDFFKPLNTKATVKKKQFQINGGIIDNQPLTNSGGTIPPIQNTSVPSIPKVGSLTTTSENSKDEQYFLSRQTHQGNKSPLKILAIGSPKLKLLQTSDNDQNSQMLNSGRQFQMSNRRLSNLPGIKQATNHHHPQSKVQSDSNLVTVGVMNNQQSSKHNSYGMGRNLAFEDMSPAKSGATSVLSQPQLMNQQQYGFQGSTSRNKIVIRGPKTLVTRTQGEDFPNAGKKAVKLTAYSGSPERPSSQFAQPNKLREIPSTLHLIQQAYQPGIMKPETIRALAVENHHSSLSGGGSIGSDDGSRGNYGGTLKTGVENKTKRSQLGTRRGQRAGMKPPILPTGIVAPSNNTPSISYNSEVPTLQKLNKNGSGPFSTYSGGVPGMSSNQQNSSYFASPDERQRIQIKHKLLPQTKLIGRNANLQQPHTVREEVVQISANLSSTNTSQQRGTTISVKENPIRTPFKVRTIIQDSRQSQPPSSANMQVWSAVTMGSGGSHDLEIGSADGSVGNLNSGSQVTKRNVIRPSAIIKVRRQNNLEFHQKQQTLRQTSNDKDQLQILSDLGSRDRMNSNGQNCEVAVIDALDEEDEMSGVGEDEDSIERQQRNRRKSQAFQQRIQLLKQQKTKRVVAAINTINLGTNEIANMQLQYPLSRNSPLARGGVNYPVPQFTAEDALSPQSMQNASSRAQAFDFTTSNQSLLDSQNTQWQATLQQRNRLPPSIKNFDQQQQAVFNSNGQFSNQEQEIGQKQSVIKKKIKSSEEDTFTRPSLPQNTANHRTSKFASLGGGGSTSNNQYRTTNSQPPAYQNEQQSSSNSSKIDRILAKIEKNRSDTVLKNQIGMILKRGQVNLHQTNNHHSAVQILEISTSQDPQQQQQQLPSHRRRESLSQKLIKLRRETNYNQGSTLEESPPNIITRVQVKKVEEIKKSQSGENIQPQLIKQQKKTLKIVTAQTNANFLNAVATQAFNTIQPSTSQNVKIKKKNFKLSKASAGGGSNSSLEQPRSNQHQANVNDQRRNQQQGVNIKHFRGDARSHDLVGTIIEGQGIYLPADVSQQETNSNAIAEKTKKVKKKLLMLKVNNEGAGTQPPIVVSTSGDSQIANYNTIQDHMQTSKPIKKSILHSMQPQEPKKKAISGVLMMQGGGNSLNSQQIAFSTDGSGSGGQSTEMSTNTYPLIRGLGNSNNQSNVKKTNPFVDQSSLLCITSASGQQLQFNPTQYQTNPPMTIMTEATIPVSPGGKRQKFPLGQQHHNSGGGGGSQTQLFYFTSNMGRTSIKENPLECSQKSGTSKISARYYHPTAACVDIQKRQMQIQEELNEEKESSSNSNEDIKRQENIERPSNANERRVTNNQGNQEMEEDLQIQPIDSDDKLFKNINLTNSKHPPRIHESQQSYAGRRLNKRDLRQVTTVLEMPSGSEIGTSSQNILRSRAVHPLVVSRVPSNQDQPQQLQRYSQLEAEEIHEVVVVVQENKRMQNLMHHSSSTSDLEEQAHLKTNEEDDEAIVIAHNPQFTKTTFDEPQFGQPNPQAAKTSQAFGDLGLLNKRQSMNRKKHWLLDSDRFDIILQNNNPTQTQKDISSQRYANQEDDDSQMMQSDTVIFEKDQSSLHGTPPKIAQKMNQKTTVKGGVKTGGDQPNMYEEISDISSQLNQKNHLMPPTPEQIKKKTPFSKNQNDSSVNITDSSRAAMMENSHQLNNQQFAFTQKSFDEIKDAQQNTMVNKLIQPLENLPREQEPKKVTTRVMSSLNKEMSITKKDRKHPINPHWIMQKQARFQPPLDHYLRPTYYDVIYLQPNFDQGLMTRTQPTSSQNSSSHLSRGSLVLGVGGAGAGSFIKFHRPGVLSDSRNGTDSNNLRPKLEQFNFDALLRN